MYSRKTRNEVRLEMVKVRIMLQYKAGYYELLCTWLNIDEALKSSKKSYKRTENTIAYHINIWF